VKVTLADVRAVRYCARGARDFFVRHGLNWQSFVQQGIDARDLPADPMAQAVIAAAHKRGQDQIGHDQLTSDESHGK